MVTLAVVALVVSALLMAGMVAVLVMLRRGEGPEFSASRAYDANRREAVRVLTGHAVDRMAAEQWFDPERGAAAPGDPLAAEYRRLALEALRAAVPPERGLSSDEAGPARLAAEDVRVLPALSTADLRNMDLDAWDDRDRLLIGLVLLNPEPPGGDARRVTLPVQVLFPALERTGREDLIREFEDLMERATR